MYVPMMGWEAWLVMAAWTFVLAILVWLVVREPSRPSARQQALDTLRARFAHGELSREEFQDACAALDLVDGLRPGDRRGRGTSAGDGQGPAGRETTR